MDPTTTPPSRFYVKDYSEKFGAVEYVVFSSVLVASAGIGVYYGWIGRKKAQTNDEFLTAGKSMPILPVALSLICSFVSAITILGNPPEVYYYGTQYLLIATGFIPITLALAYIYVPVFFRLQLTSAYEVCDKFKIFKKVNVCGCNLENYKCESKFYSISSYDSIELIEW